MSPQKLRQQAEIRSRHDKVLALVGKSGSLTAVEIIADMPDISIGTIGHLVKTGKLVAHATGRRTKNSNHIYAYALQGETPKPQKKIKKQIRLEDVFMMRPPKTSAKPYVVFDMDKRGHYGMAGMNPHRGFGVQSSMVSLINAMG